jgi:hypothetical protein
MIDHAPAAPAGLRTVWRRFFLDINCISIYSRRPLTLRNRMELKVACECGQKYKFDVEPVEGRMPFAVSCPVCGVDGTLSANQLLTQQSASAVPTALVPLAPAAGAGGLRINRPAPVAAAPPLFASSASPTPLPVSTPTPAAATRPGVPIRNLVSPPVKAQPTYNLWLGILGAFVGAAVGGGLMYGFFLWSGFRMPYTGTAVGLIAGFSSRGLARGGDMTLGVLAATFSVLSVLCVMYAIYHGDFGFGIIAIVISGVVAYKAASY